MKPQEAKVRDLKDTDHIFTTGRKIRNVGHLEGTDHQVLEDKKEHRETALWSHVFNMNKSGLCMEA